MCERCREAVSVREKARDKQRLALHAQAKSSKSAAPARAGAATGARGSTAATGAKGSPAASSGAAGAAPKRPGSIQPDAAARPEDLQGTLKGPYGPLRQWPFRLLRDGVAVDAKALGAKGPVPPTRGGLWLSDAQGRYRFAGVPAGEYRVEIVRPGVQLKAVASAPPIEPGHRAAPPAAVEHHGAEHCELPENPDIPDHFDA